MEQNTRFGYRSLFWPIVLIGLGVIWLLGNLGVLPQQNVRILFRLWPLILVVIGLDIIFGRRSPAVGGLIGLGTVALAIVLLFLAPSLGLAADGELKTLNFSEALGNATSGRIDLDLDRYQTTVKAVSDSSALIEAELDTTTDVAFSASGDREKTVILKPVRDPSFDFDWLFSAVGDARWEIGLNPEVPLDLRVNVGSGAATLDLADLELTGLEIGGGSGSTNLTLPAGSSRYTVDLNGGSGSFIIELDAGADVRAVMDIGSGSIDITIGSGADVQAQIGGGSGSVAIDAPDDVGVRVVVSDRGSGSVRVPGNYRLVDNRGDDDSDTGIWESEGFGSASHRVEITFDPGSGSFTLR